MFKFTGRRPADLGAEGGRFKAAPSWKPNWVSSQVATTDAHYIAPLKVSGDGKAAMGRLAKVVQSFPRAVIVTQKDGYLYAEFSTALMGYTDDVEFVAAPGEIHVRSSSRLGIRDFDVNRKRIDAVRAGFDQSR
jgi:uncharacterized protein (DUF1499 family)